MASRKKRFLDVIVVDPFTVQFCALSVILLAFFILLNSMAVIDQEKVRLALGSLIGTFGRMPGGAAGATEPGMLSNQSIEVTQEEIDELTMTLAELLGQEDLDGDVDVYLRDDDVVIRIEGSALFAEGSDELLPGAETALGEIAERLRSSERPVSIEGHTDAQSTVHSEYGTPWMFAAARAARIHDFLLDAGLPPQRLTVSSLGRTRPCRPNENERQRSLNRRIEIVIEEGVTDPMFRPRTRTVRIGGIAVEVQNTPPPGSTSWGASAESQAGGT